MPASGAGRAAWYDTAFTDRDDVHSRVAGDISAMAAHLDRRALRWQTGRSSSAARLGGSPPVGVSIPHQNNQFPNPDRWFSLTARTARVEESEFKTPRVTVPCVWAPVFRNRRDDGDILQAELLLPRSGADASAVLASCSCGVAETKFGPEPVADGAEPGERTPLKAPVKGEPSQPFLTPALNPVLPCPGEVAH